MCLHLAVGIKSLWDQVRVESGRMTFDICSLVCRYKFKDIRT